MALLMKHFCMPENGFVAFLYLIDKLYPEPRVVLSYLTGVDFFLELISLIRPMMVVRLPSTFGAGISNAWGCR